MSERLALMKHWLAEQYRLSDSDMALEVIADDASFRRYFRLELPDHSTRIIMDAPPEHEDSTSFVTIDRLWHAADLPVPGIEACSLEQGFMVLEDLGNTMLRQALEDEHRIEPLIEQAIALSVRVAAQPAEALPDYDATRLGSELDLFPEWCLPWLGLDLPPGWVKFRNALVERLLDQPRVTTHRDYTPQNIMVQGDRLRLIDFQGAWHGPLSFDMTCLLRDRHQPWPAEDRHRWLMQYHARAISSGLIPESHSRSRFLANFEDTSAQRSIKVLGGFCRTAFRDHKPRYLAYMPCFLAHTREALCALGETTLLDWFTDTFTPRLDRALNTSTENTP
ncbi:aminoglycoside phosphotransferase family protein [Larsenimonas rhizosphaerae]|uniref:aminoglycoside phosphotransferase family protein n=1 Tax=Larsenimonas rhizosphaerae TaxID=2944682 RepID=UPI0020334778|nr:phosphotransferase [Larsenimonas rhizosphaerae]MCM2130178.1 phosphotransferase [Larsenimonas rhizosphaerae]